MEQTLYLECYSGLSGDMAVAALLDLGADRNVLLRALDSLPISGFTTKISRVKKSGLDACDFHVVLQQENHDHDMEYLHPDIKAAPGHPSHTHSIEKGTHTQGHSQPHMHRSLADILAIIQESEITGQAKQIASKIFTTLGQAEAKAHGTSLEDVHFHEVGAVDSIVDIVATAVCLDNLGINHVIIPVLYEGCGTVHCQHGILPIPVPAVVNILQAYHIPLHLTGTQGEFVTPTGAAIAAAICTGNSLPKQFQIIRTGLGAGKRTYERPSLLRAMLIQPEGPSCQQCKDTIYKLETNLDDCTGEAMGFVFKRLMDAGAKDVHYFPVYMKKNRPAYQLNVLCEKADIPKLEQIIFGQTTTLGIRRQCMERTILPRKSEKVQTCYGEVLVKICEFDGKKHIYPEYSSIAKICEETGCPYPEMYQTIQTACQTQLS